MHEWRTNTWKHEAVVPERRMTTTDYPELARHGLCPTFGACVRERPRLPLHRRHRWRPQHQNFLSPRMFLDLCIACLLRGYESLCTVIFLAASSWMYLPASASTNAGFALQLSQSSTFFCIRLFLPSVFFRLSFCIFCSQQFSAILSEFAATKLKNSDKTHAHVWRTFAEYFHLATCKRRYI